MNLRVAASLLALSIAGCSHPVTCTPIPFTTVVAPPALIAPAPGATGVATSGLTITITYQTSSDEAIRVVGDDGSTIVSGPLSPNAQPNYQGAVSATLTGLSPHMHYTVTTVGTTPFVPATDCVPARGGPYAFTLAGGGFTTQ